MEIYRVALIGHRVVEQDRAVEAKLWQLLSRLLREKDFVEFFIGRNGEFDILAASCIKQLQKSAGHHRAAITLVLPYPVANMEYLASYYDGIFIPEEARAAHPKAAITKRNQWLVQHSDLLIAYTDRREGGATACLRMAERARLEIIRIETA